MGKILSLALIGLLQTSLALANEMQLGSLTLYRWNKGFRAEAVQAAEMPMSDKDFRQLLSGAEPPAKLKDSIYPGCYLASYKTNTRAPASLGKPSSEIHRICWPRK